MSGFLDRLPPVRGKLVPNEQLAPFTWFRVGGAADALFLPKDEADLAEFLAKLDPLIPVTVLGAASNVIVRDGGIAGVVVRLGPAFGKVAADGLRVTAGAAALDGARVGCGGECGHRGDGVLLRRAGHDRWSAAHECGVL